MHPGPTYVGSGLLFSKSPANFLIIFSNLRSGQQKTVRNDIKESRRSYQGSCGIFIIPHRSDPEYLLKAIPRPRKLRGVHL